MSAVSAVVFPGNLSKFIDFQRRFLFYIFKGTRQTNTRRKIWKK
jgi:hypothetical protein